MKCINWCRALFPHSAASCVYQNIGWVQWNELILSHPTIWTCCVLLQKLLKGCVAREMNTNIRQPIPKSKPLIFQRFLLAKWWHLALTNISLGEFLHTCLLWGFCSSLCCSWARGWRDRHWNLFQSRAQKHTWLWLLRFPLCRWEKPENSQLHSWHLAGLEPSPETSSIGILVDTVSAWTMTEHCKCENSQSASGRDCSSEFRVLGGAGGECEHPGHISVCAHWAPVWLSHHSAGFSKSARHCRVLPLHRWWDLHR